MTVLRKDDIEVIGEVSGEVIDLLQDYEDVVSHEDQLRAILISYMSLALAFGLDEEQMLLFACKMITDSGVDEVRKEYNRTAREFS